jgi:hypothetical protein
MAADETVRIDTVGTSDVYVTSVKKAAAETRKLDAARKEAIRNAKAFQAQVFTGVAAAATAAATGFVAATRAQIEAVRELDRVSKSANIATRTVAGLRKAAIELEQELDSVVPVDLADKLQELREGNETWAADFALLGLAAEDFAAVNWDVTQSLELIVKAMGKTTDKQIAAGASSRLLSTAGENLFAVFGDGTKTLEDYALAAEKGGLATQQAQEDGRKMAAAMTELSLAVEQATAKIGEFAVDAGVFELVKDFARGLTFAVNELGDAVNVLVDSPMPRLYAALGDLATKALRPFVTESEHVRREMRELGYAIEFVGDEGELLPQRLEGTDALALLAHNAKLAREEFAKLHPGEVTDAFAELLSTFEKLTTYEIAAELARIPDEAQIQVLAGLATMEAAVEESIDRTIIAEEEAARRRYMTQAEYYGSIADLALQSSNDIGQIAENLNVKNKGFLTAAFLIQRASAVGQASLLGILATQQALASAPPPYNFVLAGITGTAAALNVAAIATTPTPTFHIGTRAGDLAPDEMTVTRRETPTAVLTPQAVAELNAGRGRQPDAAPIYVLMDHEVAGLAVARTARRPGSAMRQALGGDLPGHSYRRGRL